MSAIIEGKVDELINLFTYLDIKRKNKSKLCFEVFVDISDGWDALFASKLFISFSVSPDDTV